MSKWVIVSTPSDAGEVETRLRSIPVFRSQLTSSSLGREVDTMPGILRERDEFIVTINDAQRGTHNLHKNK